MRTILTFMVLVSMVDAAAQRRELKQAQDYEAKRFWAYAMESYFDALARKPNEPDAVMGLTRTGQHVVDDTLTLFRSRLLAGDRAGALLAYDATTRLIVRANEYKVKLTVPEFDRRDAEKAGHELEQETRYAREQSMRDLYAEAQLAETQGRSADAERAYASLCTKDPHYNDACARQRSLQAAASYAEGKAHWEGSRWCSAHEAFERTLEKVADYKDARRLLEECQTKGTQTLLVMPINGDHSTEDLLDALHDHILGRLIARQGTFLRMVDRQNIDVLLNELEFCMSPLVGSDCAVRAGDIKGASLVMIIDLKELEEEDEGLDRMTRHGIAWYETSHDVIDHYLTGPLGTVPVYRKQVTDHKDPVTYEEASQQRSVRLRLNFRIIDVSKATVIHSYFEPLEVTDEMAYIDYAGDKRFLHATDHNGALIRDQTTVNKLLRGKRTIKTMDELRNELHAELANLIARQTTEHAATLCH